MSGGYKMKKLILTIFIVSVFSAVYAGTLTRDDINEVVIDSTNSLMWQDDTEAGDGSNADLWGNAITYCESLQLGGYSDWRLPNINELRSLVDYSEINYTNAIFTNVDGFNSYWSSTTVQDPSTPDNAWTIILWLDGSGFPGDKATDNLDIRCVRSTN